MPQARAARRRLEQDDAQRWTATSPLLDLDDPKLRLRAQSIVQLCKTEREQVLALYACVKRMPFAMSFKMRLHTAREVLQQGRGDSFDKATLLVALLRLAGFPARLRFLTLDGAVIRGLLGAAPRPVRPVLEVFRDSRWIATDTYIFDGPYAAAARRRLRDSGWTHGWGMCVHGAALWDGQTDAFLNGDEPHEDGLVLHDHGVFCDPLEFVSSPSYREIHGRLARAVQWNVLASGLERGIRELRQHLPDTAACGTPA
ncbi:transglutaminase-like domain-containing protein [Ramlibacter humi]|nr:transglutaminase-like domain-containing protein [Ramlibacter humi]